MDRTDKLLLGLMVLQGFVVIWRLWQCPSFDLNLRIQEPQQTDQLQEEPFLPPVVPAEDVPYALPADDDSWWKNGEPPPWERE